MLTYLQRCISLLHSFPKLTTNSVKQIHAQIITNAIKSPAIFANLIIHYCSSQHHQHIAHSVFHHFDNHTPHLFLFNTLIRCLPPSQSFLIFQNHFSKGLTLFDHHTFIFLFGACARCPSRTTFKLGTQLHALMLKQGFDNTNVSVPTTKLHFYASNREIISARKVFDEISEKNIVTWNAMITGYCNLKEGNGKYAANALCLFKDMLVDDMSTGVKVIPTDTTIVCVLSAASQLGMLETGACIHGFAEKTLCRVEDDVFIGTGLVDMYSKCGCLDSALSVFWQMKSKNVLTWTAITTGLAIHGKGKEALEVLYKMGDCGLRPNEVTFTSLLSACCHAGLVEEGLRLFCDMKEKFGVTPLIQHYGCVVDLLGRAGKLKECYDFIMEMQISPDAVIWRSLLAACKIHEDAVMGEMVGKFLLQLRNQGSSELAPKSEDYVALSNIYASVEKWSDVETIRKKMRTKGILNKAGSSSVQTVSMAEF